MPQISVIVPVYKVEPYLRRCVDSILAQTFTDFELILVDDGSPDNCPAICDEYAEKDIRVVVIHQQNGGLSAARNAGIDWAFANSDSQWLSFIDSDDWVHPEYLERLLDAALSNDTEIAFCTLTAFTEDDHGYQEVPFWEKPVYCVRESVEILHEASVKRSGCLSGHHVIACNKIYKKELFRDIRYPHGQVHEDEAVAHRVIGACKKVACIAEPLYYYRQHANSITKENVGYYRSLCIALAYGDRILYHQEMQIVISDALYDKYWTTLVGYFCKFYDEDRCVKLIDRVVQQMRKIVESYIRTNASSTRKLGVILFCCMPKYVSRLFCISVKMRGG